MSRCKCNPEKICNCKKETSPALKDSNESQTVKGLIVGRDIIPITKTEGLTGEVVGSVDEGDIVEIVEKKEGFDKIKCCNNVVGFIPSVFIVEAVNT